MRSFVSFICVARCFFSALNVNFVEMSKKRKTSWNLITGIVIVACLLFFRCVCSVVVSKNGKNGPLLYELASYFEKPSPREKGETERASIDIN